MQRVVNNYRICVLRGCESETDTEEFEKVGQSPLDLNFDKEIPSPKPSKQDASTCTEVGEKSPIPPKKPPRSFQKLQIHHEESVSLQRTLSVSSSNTDSFTNVKIDEFSSRNYSSNTTADSCFNSHHQQMQSGFLRSKSLSPHTPQSPRDCGEYVISPTMLASQQQQQQLGHQPVNEFATDEFYIDESLPSSLSIETGHSHGEFVRQLDTANNVVAMLQVDFSDVMSKLWLMCLETFFFFSYTHVHTQFLHIKHVMFFFTIEALIFDSRGSNKRIKSLEEICNKCRLKC